MAQEKMTAFVTPFNFKDGFEIQSRGTQRFLLEEKASGMAYAHALRVEKKILESLSSKSLYKLIKVAQAELVRRASLPIKGE